MNCGARGCLASVGPGLIPYIEKDIQFWLQECKLKFAAFRASKIKKKVLNTSTQTRHGDATLFNTTPSSRPEREMYPFIEFTLCPVWTDSNSCRVMSRNEPSADTVYRYSRQG